MNLFETENKETNFKRNKKNNRGILLDILSSNLNFEKNYQYFGKHNWHPFPAKFPPQLPHIFIKNLTEEKESVLDPMAGSCTTLIEAQLLNRNALGFDIDPLSLLVGQSKFLDLKPDLIKKYGENIINKAYINFSKNNDILQNELNNFFDEETRTFIDYWFLKTTQLEIISIILEINKIKRHDYKIFFKALLSTIIVAKTGGVSLAIDLAHTRPHKVKNKKPNSAFEEYSKKLKKISKDLNFSSPGSVKVKMADAKNLPLPSEHVDLIVTSPPYANNAIDYIRAHKFSLVWFGYKISELRKIRKEGIGSDASSANTQKLPLYAEQIIKKIEQKNPRKSKYLQKYFGEMLLVFREMYRVLKKDKCAIVVVASSIIEGIDTQTHLSLVEIGKSIGFNVVGIGERIINRDRRMMPVSNNRNSNQIETRMHKEFILGFIKE